MVEGDRMRTIYRMPVRIRSYEVDAHGRLQAPILCRLLQEAATIHAADLGVSVESLIDGGVAWVLSRLSLAMDRWPGVEDEVVIETWPEALDRLTTERRFEIRGATGDRLGHASTLWLVLDLHRRRPIRVPAAVADALSRHELGDRPVRPAELEVPDPVDRAVRFTVRRSDLDKAGHANNTSYVEWALEAVPDRVWEAYQLAELHISYRSECRRGAEITSGSLTSDGGATCDVLHRLIRSEDGEVAAVARSAWRLADHPR
jgi:medium-chain acyl-[acyl-carrier-protein] hydrolase